jgi:CDP-diacylglycerol--glycerol-3-phosphate 3-phosphatidyltransferase
MRKYSTQSPPSSTPSTLAHSQFAALGGLTSELDRVAPGFAIEPSQIEILKSPTDFYETLKVKEPLVWGCGEECWIAKSG